MAVLIRVFVFTAEGIRNVLPMPGVGRRVVGTEGRGRMAGEMSYGVVSMQMVPETKRS
jgi:hypothetical protein